MNQAALHLTRPWDARVSKHLALTLTLGISACSAGGDDGRSGGSGWSLALSELDGALISVSGRTSSDVWLAGADTKDGQGALVLHYDGSSFSRRLTGQNNTLWWVHVLPDVEFFSGERGTILRHDASGFTKMQTPGDGTVFGIWGASENDLWAVGGLVEGPPGFVWHYDGQRWTDRSKELPISGRVVPQIFKVFGHAVNDVMFVGNDGAAFHFDGSTFTRVEVGSSERIFTVHGPATGGPRYVAVGGFGSAVMLEGDEDHFSDVAPRDSETMQLFGVFMREADHGYAVGVDGLVMRREADGWQREETGVDLSFPFHAVWVDPDGGVWAVGGDVLTPYLDRGMLLHKGLEIPHDIEN